MRQRRGKLAFNAMLKNKIRKPVVLFLGGALIATLWGIEKTKRIPQYGKVFYEMGLGCDNKCGKDRQLRYFQQALRYSPELSDAYYHSALIYEEKGDHTGALASLKRAVEFDRGNIPAYYYAGLLYFQQGAYEYALRYFLQTYRPHRGYFGDADYYLARIYDQKKEYDLAIEHYFESVDVHPEHMPAVYPRLAEIYYSLDREKDILRKIYQLREVHRNNLADQLEQSYNALKADKEADSI